MPTSANALSRDLAELNESFLELVAGGTDAGLAPAVLARLRALDPALRPSLGQLPFALFGFGFEDEADWAVLLSPGVRDLEPAYTLADSRVERFSLLALTTLRGFAHSAPHNVSAWIGLPEQTRLRLAALELGLLGHVAALATERLRGRRSIREPEWLRLLDATERRDARQLKVLAGLGKQWAIRRSLGIELAAPARRRHRA